MVFSGVGFALGEGEALIVTGPNGSGKSTLLQDRRGAAAACRRQRAARRRRRGISDSRFGRALSRPSQRHEADADGGRESRHSGGISAATRSLAVEAALETVGLGAIGHLPYGYLSTGQRRRAAIARLLVSRRPVWLLDEPTAGLDAESERQFAALMETHLAGGGIIVAATHLPLGMEGATELRMRVMPESSHPPLACRPSPPQGGRLAASRSPIATPGWRTRTRNLPLEGEMAGRPRGRHECVTLQCGRHASPLPPRTRLAIRAGGGALTGVLFFLAVVATIPFALGPDLNLLARIGPAVLWIGALLASLLGLDRLFQADREDGSLDLLVLSADRHMLALTVFVKCLAHWTASVLPLVVAAPLLGLFLNMEPAGDRRDRADAARRHAGHHLHRRGGCGGRGRRCRAAACWSRCSSCR